jgi:two-component system chemotaxis response regulator CheY
MKFLIIDDDPVSRAALMDIIGPLPELEVREAGNGVEALAELRAGYKPDLCLLDLQMPDMGGLELLQRMRGNNEYRNLRVVVTSSTRDRKTIEALAKLQISGYLLKPFDRVKTLVALQPPAHTATAATKLQGKPAKLSLLAVDDDPVVRTVIAEHVLRTDDWDLQLAADGDEAFELLYAGLRPDLIITDLTMPKSDGVAFINRIRKDRNFTNMNVAVISGDQNEARVAELAQLNVFSWMRKPVEAGKMDALFNQVRRLPG